MKRYGNLYDNVASVENIAIAHAKAKRGKSHYDEVRMVEGNPERYFEEIHHSLLSMTFRNSEYEVFLKTDGPKEREIWKLPYYPDRIVHHCIVNVLEPIWIRSMIRDTYSAIPRRGVHDGVRRIRKALQSDSSIYCLKMDVKKFYQSIDHEILKQQIRKKIKDSRLLWLLDEIINSAPGVPIGNYTSQYFGNIYLNGLDHYIKEVLCVKHYYRYCDDMVLIGDNKERLHEIRLQVKEYLDGLLLEMKGNWQVFPIEKRGIDFLGYRFFKNYTLVRKLIVANFKRKNKKNRDSLPSYNGWFVWANTHNLRKKYACL